MLSCTYHTAAVRLSGAVARQALAFDGCAVNSAQQRSSVLHSSAEHTAFLAILRVNSRLMTRIKTKQELLLLFACLHARQVPEAGRDLFMFSRRAYFTVTLAKAHRA